MSSDTVFRGICSRCASAPGCTLPRDASRPIETCDDFAEPGGPARRAERERPDGPPAPQRSTAPEIAEALMGLCRTCVHALDCQFVKPEGGVWHCEEFE